MADSPPARAAPCTLNQPASLACRAPHAGAAELGLTHEPDAVSLTLLASSAAAAASDGRGEASPSSSSPPPSSSAGSAPQRGGAFTGSPLDTLGSTLGSSSIGSTDAEEPTAAAAAGRHVLVMGCDGLWDVMSNNDAVGLALR